MNRPTKEHVIGTKQEFAMLDETHEHWENQGDCDCGNIKELLSREIMKVIIDRRYEIVIWGDSRMHVIIREGGLAAERSGILQFVNQVNWPCHQLACGTKGPLTAPLGPYKLKLNSGFKITISWLLLVVRGAQRRCRLSLPPLPSSWPWRPWRPLRPLRPLPSPSRPLQTLPPLKPGYRLLMLNGRADWGGPWSGPCCRAHQMHECKNEVINQGSTRSLIK